MASSLDREQLRHVVLRLFVKELLSEVAEQAPKLADFLHTQMRIYSKLVADDVQDLEVVGYALEEPFVPSLDTQQVSEQIASVSDWISRLLVSIMQKQAI